MMTAVWVVAGVLVIMWTVGPAMYFLGHRLGRVKASQEWKALADAQAKEWQILADELAAELAKAEADLQLAWQAGIMHGQVWRADREAEGL